MPAPRLPIGLHAQPVRVDRDRVRRGHHRPSIAEAQDRALRDRVGPQPHAGAEEVLPVFLGLERDDVGAEEAVQQHAAPGQTREELVGRERDVQEEADWLRGAEPPELQRNAGKLVVVDPEEGSGRRDGKRALRKALIDVLVAAPPAPVDRDPVGETVKQRPQRAVGESVVVALYLSPRQRDRYQLRAQTGKLGGYARGLTRPPHPGPLPGLEGGPEGRRGPPGAGRQPALVFITGRRLATITSGGRSSQSRPVASSNVGARRSRRGSASVTRTRPSCDLFHEVGRTYHGRLEPAESQPDAPAAQRAHSSISKPRSSSMAQSAWAAWPSVVR